MKDEKGSTSGWMRGQVCKEIAGERGGHIEVEFVEGEKGIPRIVHIESEQIAPYGSRSMNTLIHTSELEEENKEIGREEEVLSDRTEPLPNTQPEVTGEFEGEGDERRMEADSGARDNNHDHGMGDPDIDTPNQTNQTNNNIIHPEEIKEKLIAMEDNILNIPNQELPNGMLDWYSTLRKGSQIDCQDTNRKWYPSTILNIYIQNNIHYAQVGFRLYDPQGNKTDAAGKKFNGWSEQFDETVQLYSLRIQKYLYIYIYIYSRFKMVTREGELYYNPQKDDDKHPEDISDMLINYIPEQPVYVIMRIAYCKSALIMGLANKFGKMGGFSKIIEIISSENFEHIGI